jgi:hypothetical protein
VPVGTGNKRRDRSVSPLYPLYYGHLFCVEKLLFRIELCRRSLHGLIPSIEMVITVSRSSLNTVINDILILLLSSYNPG